MTETVVLGLSGGVDSAVSAALLRQKGYQVHGVYLDVGVNPEGVTAAQAVAENLHISFQCVDIREELEAHVCSAFAEEYTAGKTPLPCARCNRLVKFPTLLRVAEQIGAKWVATGHYARVRRESEQPLLCKGLPANDQSYLLSRISRQQLERTLFPLGEMEKTQVRALAEQLGIAVAHKPDSMEICFIPDQDYAAWLERRGEVPPPGNFVDEAGNVLGRHKGIHHYTLGQRRGLGIPAAHRLFVCAIRPGSNEVVLSDGGDLMAEEAYGRALNVLMEPFPTEVTVRLRHSKHGTPAHLELRGDQVKIDLLEPARAPTPGQMAVFYQGDVVAGSAWIAKKEETVWN
jgi:tRNA-specific 2-thiouridylase